MTTPHHAVALSNDPTLLDGAIETIAQAFANDPTWSPLLVPTPGNLDQSRAYWGLFIRSAQRYPLSFGLEATAAVSIWFPPGSHELTDEENESFADFAAELLGERTRDALLETGERFEAAHPDEPHNYLSLLGVHPSRRGEGLGMKLLAENLALFDARGEASYLESSNPANDEKYARLGFEPHGHIDLPTGLRLTTMWRDPR